jgi:hypothetical protein
MLANSEKTCPSAALSTTNPTRPDQGSNPGRRGGKPADNYTYSVASTKKKKSTFFLTPDAKRKSEILRQIFGFALVSIQEIILHNKTFPRHHEPSWDGRGRGSMRFHSRKYPALQPIDAIHFIISYARVCSL